MPCSLGWSFAIFVVRQDVAESMRCRLVALTAIGGFPKGILCGRMKAVVFGEENEAQVIFNEPVLPRRPSDLTTAQPDSGIKITTL